MKEIVVISGKGGTGKTGLTASLCSLAKNSCFADCDVDAADLHLLLQPEIKERHEFRSGKTAVIDRSMCKACGKCLEVCRFEAISRRYQVDPIACEGCGICSRVCPCGAVKMEENLSGEWFISETKYGPMVHAKLGAAEENSGKLVTIVRQKAKDIGKRQNKEHCIIDGPPGIGCPVIASLSGADLAVIVTEPTLSGIHDMERVADVAAHFGVKVKIVINKFDINVKNTKLIKKIAGNMNVDIVAELPFSEKVSKSIAQGIPIVEYCDDLITKRIADVWEKIQHFT